LPLVKTILVADPEAIRYIVAERKKFVKPLLMYGPLAMYGPNVGVSEGTEYQRHKKIVASSNLLENINELAWEHSMKTLDSCFEEWQLEMRRTGQREVKVQSIVFLTLKMALFVILGAAFSHSPPWSDDSPDSKPGQHKMSFKDAMHSVLENVWYKIALPQVGGVYSSFMTVADIRLCKFAYKLPYFTHPKHVQLSYKEFTQYLCEMIDARRLEGSADNEKAVELRHKKQDLLGAFVSASGEGEGEVDYKRARLTNQEVCSNIYVFLLAGHGMLAPSASIAVVY
jgi:cytochrome P450